MLAPRKMNPQEYSVRNIVILILFLSSCLLLLNGCNLTRNNVFAPNKRLLRYMPDSSTLTYRAGWQDGCETGLATGFANDFYKTFYKWQKDIEMVRQNDPYYLRAWSAAMIYCRHFATGTLKEAGMTPKLPGKEKPWGLHEHSILGNVMSPKNWGSVGFENW